MAQPSSPGSRDERRRAPRGPLSKNIRIAIGLWIVVMLAAMAWWLSIPRP
jgi:hypothetical protein